jgi:uncharacterized membrane protein YgcG
MTLMETMLAVFILLVMSMVVFETMRASIEFSRILETRDATTRTARVALSKMKRELQLAYLTPHRQAIETYQTVFVGEDGDPDVLYFASLGHQRIYMNTRECDQTEITLWTEDSPDERGRGYVLYHREAPRVDEEPDEDGPVFPLAYNVRSFNLRYLDSQTAEWRDDWDTRGADTPYRLPRSVEIGLVLISEDPEDPDRTIDVPFLTTVLLQYGERILNPQAALLGQLMGNSGGAGGPNSGGASTPSTRGGTSGRSGSSRSPGGGFSPGGGRGFGSGSEMSW